MSITRPEFLLHAARHTRSRPMHILPPDGAEENSKDAPLFEWLHVCAVHPNTPAWLQAQHGLDPLIVEAMTAEETRPRILVRPYGVMIILRAMNLHPGAEPEDMISIRLWLDDKRVITARRRDIVAVEDIYQLIEEGRGPQTSGDFLTTIVQRLFERMEIVLEDLEDTLSAAEEQLALGNAGDIAGTATLIRRRTAIFSRYIMPQRTVLEGLLNADISWLDNGQKEVLHECLDRVIRYVEELREIRDRAQILNDDINNADSQRLNKITYMFSVAATVFLPLGFLTGLVGINLGGIPGAGHGHAFWWFTGACVILCGLQVLIFKKLKWF